jgi:ribonuclease BN (tRNA processing enzyme)
MELTVLGSGTCVPSGRRSSSGYWLEAGSRRLRLDCGAGSVHAMARFGLPWESLTHQVISHFHIDHVGELAALLFAFKYGRSSPRDEPLTIVGPEGLQVFAEGLAAQLRTRILEQDFPLALRDIAPGETLDLEDGVVLRVGKTRHTAESLAVRVEAEGKSLGYTGDAAPSAELAPFFEGVDVLVCECSFVDDARGTLHMTADDVSTLAADARARHLVATHFYFDPDAERLMERLARRFDGRITIAADGLRVSV